MNKEELQKETALSYEELCVYLLQKYKKPSAERESGLVRHHADESRSLRFLGGMFSLPSLKKSDKNLLRCDVLEHLLLHIKILEGKKGEKEFSDFLPAVFPIVREINDFYNGSMRTPPRKLPCLMTVKDDFENYIALLETLKTILTKTTAIYIRELALGSDNEIAERTYRAIF